MAKKEKQDEVKAVVADTKVDSVTLGRQADTEDAEKIALRKQLSDAEERGKADREARITAEKAVSEANTKVASSQSDAVKAQKTAIENAVQVATGNILAIKKELRDAMEGGDLDKQVELNETLADARWTLNNATQTQKQFTAWEEQQKNTSKKATQTVEYTEGEKAWIAENPEFITNKKFKSVVTAAHFEAIEDGIKPDTKAYYQHIENSLRDFGLKKDPNDIQDNGRDNTGNMDQDEEVVVKPKPKLVSTSAPVTNASPTSTQQRSSRSFKLTPEMQDMAHRMFGPSSSHKLSEKDAESKYAERQMEIRDRRANGEKV